MRRRVPRLWVTLLAIASVVALAGCSNATAAPAWTFGPAASESTTGSSSAAPASSGPSPSPSSVPSASAEPSASPATSPSPSEGASERPTPTPRPPDPGEPGFVAGTKANPRVIDIATTDLLLFDPTAVSVAQGETITFRVTNVGKAEHEFKVGPMDAVFNDDESAPEISGIAAGETKELTYTFTETGPYAYACHEPGHFENDMIGFVHVVPTTPYLGTRAHPRMIILRMDDKIEFVPSEVSVTPGETIMFVLPNVGTEVTHEFQLGPADRVALDQVDGQIVVEADQIEPQHVAYLTYTFGAVGPYAFACHEPGHYEAGMKGIIDLAP
jgi:uncharacterized cupredoxin-like copper-binding protein